MSDEWVMSDEGSVTLVGEADRDGAREVCLDVSIGCTRKYRWLCVALLCIHPSPSEASIILPFDISCVPPSMTIQHTQPFISTIALSITAHSQSNMTKYDSKWCRLKKRKNNIWVFSMQAMCDGICHLEQINAEHVVVGARPARAHQQRERRLVKCILHRRQRGTGNDASGTRKVMDNNSGKPESQSNTTRNGHQHTIHIIRPQLNAVEKR